MITVNGHEMKQLWEVPVGSHISHQSCNSALIVLAHNHGEFNDRVLVGPEHGSMRMTLADDALVRLVKAPPTWHP